MPKVNTPVLSLVLPCLLLSVFSPTGTCEPVASVNGKNIDSAELYTYMVKRHGYASIVNLIAAEVIRQAAEKERITVADAEIDEAIEVNRDRLDRTAIETGADFDSMLASRGQTIEMFREGERTLLLLKRERWWPYG